MSGTEQLTSAVKRRYPRHEIDTELLVTIHGADERATLRGRSLNISEGGMAGVFVTEWDLGTPVLLEFSVPVTRTPVKVKGVVRSHSGYLCGFEFAYLDPVQRDIITRTCRTLALL